MPTKNDYLSIQRDYQNALMETRQTIKRLRYLIRDVASGADGVTWLDDLTPHRLKSAIFEEAQKGDFEL